MTNTIDYFIVHSNTWLNVNGVMTRMNHSEYAISGTNIWMWIDGMRFAAEVGGPTVFEFAGQNSTLWVTNYPSSTSAMTHVKNAEQMIDPLFNFAIGITIFIILTFTLGAMLWNHIWKGMKR